MKLEMKLSDLEIIYWFGFFYRKFRFVWWEVISKIYVRKYFVIWEYGGYGLWFVFGQGWVVNILGNYGIQIEMKNGKKFFIGI